MWPNRQLLNSHNINSCIYGDWSQSINYIFTSVTLFTGLALKLVMIVIISYVGQCKNSGSKIVFLWRKSANLLNMACVPIVDKCVSGFRWCFCLWAPLEPKYMALACVWTLMEGHGLPLYHRPIYMEHVTHFFSWASLIYLKKHPGWN